MESDSERDKRLSPPPVQRRGHTRGKVWKAIVGILILLGTRNSWNQIPNDPEMHDRVYALWRYGFTALLFGIGLFFVISFLRDCWKRDRSDKPL